MNTKKFTPRTYPLVCIFVLIALFASACGTSDANVQATVNAAILTAAPGAAAAATSPAPVTTETTQTTGFCPTRRQVNDMLFGLNADGTSQDRVVEVSTEDGAWQINTGDPKYFYPVTLTSSVGLIATVHQPDHDQFEVWTGDGTTLDAFRGTFRFASCYSLDDDMNQPDAAVRILVKENFNGTFQTWMQNQRVQDWTFGGIAGNFVCPANVCPTENVAGNLAVNRTNALPTACPTFGGVATVPGNDGGPFCKYDGQVVTDVVPAGYKAEYWDGNAVQYAEPGQSITTGESTFRQK